MNASVASSIASSACCATTYLGRESPGASFHRAGRVDENRDGGAQPFLDFGLVGGVRGLILGLAAAGLTGVLAGSAPGCQHEERTEG